MSAVRPGLIANEYRYDFEILARAKYLALWDDFTQLVAQDDILQYGSHQYDMDTQYAEPVKAEDKRIAKLEWTDTEFTKLEEWVTEHGRSWEDVEKEFAGRTKNVCKNKWSQYARYGPRTRTSGEQVIPPSFGNDSRSQKLRGPEFKGLTKQDFEFVKRSLAQGSRLSVIAKEHYYRGYRQRTIIKFVFSAGWSPWTPEQDQKLREMKVQGDNDWLGISNKLPGTLRSEKEVALRCEYLTRVDHGELPGVIYESVSDFWPDDADYIQSAVARGMTFAEICEEEFPDWTPESLEEYARAYVQDRM